MLSLGPAIAFAQRIEPLSRIVAKLIEEARVALGRLPALQGSATA